MELVNEAPIRLSKRLLETVKLVTPGYRVADVGCDHAHTSVYLIQNHLASHVLALDVNPGPLSRARENVARYGLEGAIDVRMSDGLANVKPGEVDVLLIGGLGGRLMMHVLKEGRGVVDKTKELVLQPQSEIPKVRRYLHESGYHIVRDVILKEEGKYYIAMKAVPGTGERYEKEAFYRYGKMPLEEKNAALQEFLEKERKICEQIKTDLAAEKTRSKKALSRFHEIEEGLRIIREAMAYYEN